MTEFKVYSRISNGDLRPNLEAFKKRKGIKELEAQFYSRPITFDKDFPDTLNKLYDFDFHGIKEGDRVELKINEKTSKVILRRIPNPDEEDLINLDVPPPIDQKSKIFHRIITDEYRRIKSAFVKKLENAQNLDELKLYVIKNIQHAKEIAREAHTLEKKLNKSRVDNFDNPNTYILHILKIHLIYCLIDIQEIFKLVIEDKIQTQYELEDELFEFHHTKMMVMVENMSAELNKRHIDRLYKEIGDNATNEDKIKFFKNKFIEQERIFNQKATSREGASKYEYDKKNLYETELGKLLSTYYFEKLISKPESSGTREKYENLLKTISKLRQNTDSVETKALKKTDFFEKIEIEINLLRELFNITNSLPIGDSVLKDLVSLLLILQSRKNLNLDENELNDYLTDLLRVKQYYVADQSRSGSSGNINESRSGELDLTIRDLKNNGIIKSIIEAFKLSSCGKNNKSIKDHYHRLVDRYDASGNEENFIIVYSTSANFTSLWERYLRHFEIEIFRNKYRTHEIDYKEIPKSDIKIGLSTIQRQNKEMKIYHLFVNMKKS
jgi:hypothetical protein